MRTRLTIVIYNFKLFADSHILFPSLQSISLTRASADNFDQSIFVHLAGEQVGSRLFDVQQFLQIFVGHFAVLCQIIHHSFHLGCDGCSGFAAA